MGRVGFALGRKLLP